MGIGDYICVTLRGAAPWGFTVAQGEGDTYRPLVVSQVEDGGCAFLAGVQESDHVVSINGEPSADLTMEQACSIIESSTDCLQLLLKRCSSVPSEDSDADETSCGDGLESTTLHILSPKHRSPSPRELYISESQDEASYGGTDSDGEIHKAPQLLSTELHLPHQKYLESTTDDVLMSLPPGNVVELQVSLAKSTLDDSGSVSIGKIIDTENALANQETTIDVNDNPVVSTREPLSHHGVVLSSPATPSQVEVILGGVGRGDQGAGSGEGGPEISCEGEEESQEVPKSFTVTFATEETTATEDQDSVESEEDPDQPHKHRARHARLRRSESLSEKQVKEAKSKCKRIALLLKAAPPNPNNKGVLMFKKHRQRAKKYTLVSYGTGEEDPEYRSEEEEDNEDSHAVELTIVPSKDIELTNANSGTGVLSITFDKSLLEIERNLNSPVKMECETKGKGALMFAQRRLRMDEISAEHEELRRQGIPVDGIQEVQKKMEEHAYMQSTMEGHGYMDVNIHQQSQQQYQQYQGQQYYEQQQQHYQQQNYHQQQQLQQQQQQQQQQLYQQQQQNYQQQNYQQQTYQQQQYQQQYEQQQMYQQQQQQQEYHQEQQQYQQYSANMNGTIQQPTNEMQSSPSNRTAKPFTAQDMTPVAYSTANGDNQENQGEQIASRDERLSTPAFKTGILLDTRRRTGGKPMFTFKEAPKVSPNPELLNLLNRGDRKMGYESGTEEDYLSLGAEACNFLQSPRFKQKIPPPVAPKPMINPNAPPWAVQMEGTNQDMPQCSENSMITPAAAPPADTTPATEVEPAPAPEPPAPSTPQEAPPPAAAEEQHTWSVPTAEPQPQTPQALQAPQALHAPQAPQVTTAPEDRLQMAPAQQPEPTPAASWPPAQPQPSNSWHQAPPQEPPHSQSPPQPPWVTRHSASVQPPQPQANNWSPQMQQTWNQAPEQPSSQPPVQPAWAQEQPPLQQMHPAWAQPQEQQPQPPWVQPQQKPQVQPPWVQQVPESQPQPPWVQQPQAPPQGWPQSPGQPQPPWGAAQQQPPWNPQQPQSQPPWMQTAQPPPPQPQAALNPWAPVPPQPQQPWAQQPPEQSQQPLNSWAPEQNQQQHPWAQQAPPPQPPQQPVSTWQQPPAKTSPQPTAQTQPPPSWAQPSQPTPERSSLVNTRPSPKPWQAPPSKASPPPPPPQRISSFTFGQRTSSPVNPMATVLPSSSGPAYEMPTVKGKGADMFAKRQSRMEKYIVDSETVEANKASRSTSPATSLPTEWKYTPNAFGSRSYSLSPPSRVPSTGQQSLPPRPRKALTPWEAASRHPLGLVDEAFAVQDLQHTLASSVHLAAQRKILPEPPADWQARVSYQAPKKSGSQTWSQSRGHTRAPLPSFVSPAKTSISSVSSVSGYRSLPRQWQAQRSVTNLSSPDRKGPQGQSVYASRNTSWSWRR
ncbi:synaptopodin-2 isoform X2 [Boleophthalmus pectinirostris]|uniref:synaptopodin-2 isoform X2 n=1 Tax=Boleophthalmus pectinirostris TaxID=150288 RepID=UPI00242A46DB|nr:synaptopodin-2 isoform X2 [Boleophthalmus pectinirostris]